MKLKFLIILTIISIISFVLLATVILPTEIDKAILEDTNIENTIVYKEFRLENKKNLSLTLKNAGVITRTYDGDTIKITYPEYAEKYVNDNSFKIDFTGERLTIERLASNKVKFYYTTQSFYGLALYEEYREFFNIVNTNDFFIYIPYGVNFK